MKKSVQYIMHFLCIKKGKTKIRFPILFCLWNRHKERERGLSMAFYYNKGGHTCVNSLLFKYTCVLFPTQYIYLR